MKNTILNPLIISISIISLLGLLLSACSDDSPTIVPPGDEGEFSIEFKVIDTQGDPVEGIQLTLYNDHNYFQGKNHDKAMTQVRYTIGTEVRVLMHINNAAGDSIRTLVHGVQPAGYHSIVWNGENDEGVRQNSGQYNIKMRILNDDLSIVFADSLWVLASQPDADMFIATTNANGIIQLEDKCLFPQLFSLPAMNATDEEGTVLESFNVTDVMHALYRDPSTMVTLHSIINIGQDTSNITYVWDPAKGINTKFHTLRDPVIQQGNWDKKPDPEDYEYSLDLAYPNPFN